jgi:hypothetical protein
VIPPLTSVPAARSCFLVDTSILFDSLIHLPLG